MTTESSSTYRRVVELVDAALELDASARSAFLDEECAGDQALRAEIDSLLDEEVHVDDDFLEVPAVRQAVDLLADDTTATRLPLDGEAPLAHPDSVGPYRVLEELGRGGMGTVYLAEQSAPIERRIALKVIHGIAGDQVTRRFAAECRALARLKHPNIAAVHDAGVAEDDRAFVAMEWVEGAHITDWCDQRQLPITARIELFLGVCAGVGHAHQKGLVHRDLKPSNVLVAEIDGRATAKVIDFGIARTLDEVDAANSVGTLIAGLPTGAVQGLGRSLSLLMGSPMYMSPEAAKLGDRSDVDTRTDVYSLGILLYELLVGVTPYEVSGLSFGALLHQARTTDPPVPSHRWSKLDAALKKRLAGQRGGGAADIERQLRGDLDAILAKATARARDARYDSVSDLAADLQRALENRPVQARTPSLGYNLSRFVRRNVGAILAVAVVIGALVAGVVARTQEAHRANLEAEKARRALAEAEQVSDFLIGLFEVVDPDRGDDDPQSVDELLAKAEATMAEELAEQPLARARFMQTIGRIAMTRMDLDRAADLYAQALTLLETHSAPGSTEIIRNLGSQGVIFRRQGRMDEAEAVLVRAIALHDSASAPDPGGLSATLTWLANLHYSQQRYKEAIAGHRRALEIRRSETADNIGAQAESLNNLGVALRDAGRYAEARPILQEAESLFTQAFGPEHPWVVGCWLNLAGIEEQLGQWQEAEQLLVRAGETWLQIHGSVHYRTLLARRALGALWRRWHRTEEAIAHLSSLLADQKAQSEPNALEIGRTLVVLGRSLWQHGDLDEAEPVLQEALEIYSSRYGRDHAHSLRVLALLAMVDWQRGQVTEAAEQFEQLTEATLRLRGEQHLSSAWMLRQLGKIKAQLGKLDEAEPALLRAESIYQARYDGPALPTARTLFQLGRLRLLQGRRDEGAELLGRAVEIFALLLPAGHPELTTARAEATASPTPTPATTSG